MKIEQFNKKSKETIIIELPDELKENDSLICTKTTDELTWGFAGLVCTGSYKFYKLEKIAGL